MTTPGVAERIADDASTGADLSELAIEARDVGGASVDRLLARANDGVVEEVILATNFTNEGEATAHYVAEMLRTSNVKVSRIARAMVTDPELIVADEPTGDLDTKSAEEILNLMEILRAQLGKTIIMVTHDPKAAARAQRTLHLEKGQLVLDTAAEPLLAGGR